MLILGLLLIAAALVVGWAIIADATERQTLDVFGVQFDNTTGAAVFIAGAATMLALVLGIALIQLAMARARRRRQKNKALKNEKKESVHRLEEEKAQLAAELETERRRREEISQFAASGGSSTPRAHAAGVERDETRDSRQYGPPFPQGGTSHTDRTGTDRTDIDRTNTDRTDTDRTNTDRTDTDRTNTDRTDTDRTITDRTDTDPVYTGGDPRGTVAGAHEPAEGRSQADSEGGKLAGLRAMFDKNADGRTDGTDLRGRDQRTVDVTESERRDRGL